MLSQVRMGKNILPTSHNELPNSPTRFMPNGDSPRLFARVGWFSLQRLR